MKQIIIGMLILELISLIIAGILFSIGGIQLVLSYVAISGLVHYKLRTTMVGGK